MVARDFVGYGRQRPRGTWPNGARLAVSIVVNYEEGAERDFSGDGTPEGLMGEGLVQTHMVRDMYGESAFEYGSRVGVWRLLDCFRRHEVPVTFFAAGRALERNPEVGKAIADEGHEACGHGYRWIESYLMTRDEEREDIRRCVDAITRTVGVRPIGWASRGAGPNTRELLVEEGGFLYDSGSFNDDTPYVSRVGNGEILVVPYSRDVNDIRFWRPGLTLADEFFEYMKTAFDSLYAEAETSLRMMSVGTHCRISGVPGRAPAVDRFIRYAKQFPDVWFAQRAEIARWWVRENPAAVQRTNEED